MPTRPARSPAAKPAPNASQPAAARRRARQRRRPRVSRLLAWLLAAWLGHAGLALAQVAPGALPSGGQVMVGSGQLQFSPNLLVVQQNGNRLGLDWQSFNIGSGATVEFRQPGASSVALNRIVGNGGSEIYGQLKANGQVFLTNPNGVLFAPGSKVDVGGLVASTLDLSQQDFADGRYVFSAGGAQGRVVNQGSLNASAGGYLALFGQHVENQGDIAVDAGSVVLASGRAATVSISGSGLISAVVTPGMVRGSVDNGGRITADGGVVTLSAKSAQDIAASLVNSSGIVRANTLVEKAGEIWITGDQVTASGTLAAAAPAGGDAGRIVVKGDPARGSLAVDGRFDVSARDGHGGRVETSAANVNIAAGARVDSRGARGTGTWVIDPTDFAVSAGGAAQTVSGIGADTLAANLDTTSVTLATAAGGSEPGDIHVNAGVAWAADTTLTLQASRDINFNASLTATGAGAGLVLTPGAGGVLRINTTTTVKPKVTLSGVNATLSIAGQSYTLIRDLNGLDALSDPAANSTTLSGRYALVADIDAGSTAALNGGLGFDPIGSNSATSLTTSTSFSGVLQGLGHSISGLTIDRPTEAVVGLFASGLNARVENLELAGGSITGGRYVGAVFGGAQQATQLTNVWTSAPVTAAGISGGGVYVGGAVGSIGVGSGAALNRVHASGNVTGNGVANSAIAYVGGVVGEMLIGTLTDVSATGNVLATAPGASISAYRVGGVVGSHTAGDILRATASGSVTGGAETGGLIGYFSSSASLQDSSASGDVSGAGDVGGLVGYAIGTGSIAGSVAVTTATGNVVTSAPGNVTYYAGGAVGRYNLSTAPSALSASGNASGGNVTGGVIGYLESGNVTLTSGSVVGVAPANGTRTITGATWVGGLIGYSNSSGSISGLSSEATVVATGSGGAAGGLLGRSNGAVNDSSASGSVTAAGNAGGLVGNANGSGGMNAVSSTASVGSTGTGGSVGGLVGSYNNTGSLAGGSAGGAVQGGSGTAANTGGLVGSYSSAGSIVNGSTAATSTVAGGGDTGGLVGNAAGSGSAAITGSTSRGTVTGGDNVGYVGGLVGDFAMPGGWSDVTVEGAVSGGQRTGGLAGHYNSTAAITNGSYTPAEVTGGTWVGGLVGYISSTAAISGAAANNPWLLATNVTSTASNGGAGVVAGRSNGSVSHITASGTVSAEGDAGGLVGVANGGGGFSSVVASGKVSSTSTTADVGGLVGNYTNSGNLVGASTTGNVSGGRYTGGVVGLYQTNASAQTLRAEGTVQGSGDAGGLMGYASGSGTLSSGDALGAVTSSATSTYSVGGAVGYFGMTGGMSAISAAGNVAGGAYTGGVVGYYDLSTALTSASLSEVTTPGQTRTVTGVNWVGGLIGYSNASAISGLVSAADATSTGTSGGAGGLAGRTAGAVSDSSASGKVVSGSDAGGLVGYAAGTGAFTDVSASGAVRGISEVGGLVGNYSSTGALTRGSATGDVVTRTTGGGLVGYHSGGTVSQSTASGTVTALSDSTVYLGGLIGQFGANCFFCNSGYEISDSTATGAVRADAAGAFAGGLVGLLYSGSITGGSGASGSVTTADTVSPNNSSQYAGGLVGYFGYYNEGGRITDSNAIGKVSGGYYSGGLAGYFNGKTLGDSSASGSVDGRGNVGGLLGFASAHGNIANVSASGSVTGNSASYVGGLVGLLYLYDTGGVSNGRASGSVANTGSGAIVGGLLGYVSASTNAGVIDDSAATGKVSGTASGHTGGLIGYFANFGGTSALRNSYATGDVDGGSTVGGLVGYYSRSSTAGRTEDISNSHATGQVSGTTNVGGLVGEFYGRYGIAGSHATGGVTGLGSTSTISLGGLAGYYYTYGSSTGATAPLVTSYASGPVRLADTAVLGTSTTVYAGGLVGQLDGSVLGDGIVDAYATGAVTLSNLQGRLHAGGLVGYTDNQHIVRGYATGAVSATGGSLRATGGLLALRNTGNVGGSYWDSEATGQATSVGGGTAVSASAMRQGATFDGWALGSTGAGTTTWRIYEGHTAPLLTRFLTPLTLSLADASKTYDGTLSFGNAALGAGILADRIFTAAPSADVGSYSVAAGGVYSVQDGYDLTVVGSATLTVTPRALTLAGVVADKVYDGTRVATLQSAAQPAGIVAGENLTLNLGSASALFDTKDVGQDKGVTVSGVTLSDGANGKASNYTLAGSSTTASITPKALSAGGFTATNRSYDGSTTVAVSAAGGAVSGQIGSDDVTVDVAGVTSGTVATKDVGNGKAVTVLGATLSGADAGNYVIGGIDSLTVDITPRSLNVNGLTGSNRSYDQNVNVSVNTGNGILAGAVAGDVVQLRSTSVNGTMADRHVGDGKTVNVAGTSLQLRGPDAANYTIAGATATVNITPALVYFYADYNGQRDKVYDGSDVAPVVPFAYPSLGYTLFGTTTTIGLDNLTLSYDTPRYSDKHVAYSGGAVTTKTITVANAVLGGADAGNYVLNNVSATTSGRITPLPLSVTGVAATNRAYDGTTSVAVNVGSASVNTAAVISGDVVSVTLPGSGIVTGTVANKNVGNDKPVSVPGFSLSGADAGNYSLTGSSGVTVNITPKALTASYTAQDKVYDGNGYARVNVTSTDIVGGDDVRFYADIDNYNCYGCYAFFVTDTSTPSSYTLSKDAAADKRVVVTSNDLFGNDAANYSLVNRTATLTASITPKGITPVFNGVDKVYDGSTTATVNVNTSASGILSGDAVSLARTASFDTKDVGSGKTISITDIAFSGVNAGNYTLASTTATATAAITPKALSVQGVSATDRPYDGSTTVALMVGTLAGGGVVGSDVVDVLAPAGGLGNGVIADKNAGTSKPVTVSGLTLSGADAANYSIDGSQGVTVDITTRELTVAYTGVDRVYNGGVAAVVTASSADLVTGDLLSFNQNAIFTGLDARNVGSHKPVSITGITMTGSDAANYRLLNTSATTTAGITPKPITVSYVGLSRVYNGLADVTASVLGNSAGLVAGDIVTFTQTALFQGDGSAGTGKAVDVSNIALGGAHGANYSLLASTATTTATITPRLLGVTGVLATDRVYDGTRDVALSTVGATVLPAGVLAGDTVTVLLPSGGLSTGTVATKDAGSNKAVTITGLTLGGASAANYSVVGASGVTVDIAPLALTAAYSAASRVYDGSTLATVSGSSLDILAGDVGAVGISASGLFGNKNAGTGKAVAVSGGFLTGAERNNYTLLNPTGSALASITPKTLTPAYQGGTRVYDGSTLAPVTALGTGVVTGDTVGFTQTAVFTGANAKDVGSGKGIAISGITLAGLDAANYALGSTTAAASGGITPKPISIDGLTGASATNRVYDGTRTVEVVVTTSGTLSPSSADIVAGDSVAINLPSGGITTGTMATRNAGNDKALVVDGLTLTGTDAGNYTVAATTGITVDIARKPLTAAYVGIDKVYDGTTAATVGGSSSDIIGSDSVVIGGTGIFVGAGARNVGTGKSVSVLAGQLSGADAANYALVNASGSTTAGITPRPVTPTYTGLDKVYDGTTLALVSASTSGFITGDAVTLGQTAVFTGDKNVGTNKPIAVSGITLSGSDAANYSLTATSASTTGSITPRPLRIDGLTGVAATDRVYDGSNIVEVIVSATGPIAPDPADVVAGDDVTVTAPATGATTGTTLDKNVGTAKPVAVSGLNLGGADAANYSITATSGVTVDITPRPLTAVYGAVTRVYDGTALASITGTSGELIGGDLVTIGATGVFSGAGAKNVGSGKAVSVQGGSLSGADAANYSLLNPTGSTTGSITPRDVTVSYVGGTRVYDGSVAAPVVATPAGVIDGDDIAVTQTAEFTGAGAKNVGTAKPVAVSGIALGGSDAGNYLLTGTSAVVTASVTPRPLRIEGFGGIVATDRVYDGSTSVAVSVPGSGTLAANGDDLVPGDDVVVVAPPTGTSAGTLLDKNVGSNKPVIVDGVTLGGADAGNYSVAAATGVTVNITPRPLTASYAALDKVYDGTSVATVIGSPIDMVAGDHVAIGGSGLFVDGKNVGTGKTVSVGAGTLSDTDAGNYTLLNPTATASASITPRALTASYTGGTRVYDGSTSAPVTGTLSGLIAGDVVSFGQTAVFVGADARNVGVDKVVEVSGITLQGSDAANYALLGTSAVTTATVTPRPLNISGLTGLRAVDRVYDGTRDVQVTGNAVIGSAAGDVLAGDDVTINLPGGSISAGTMVDKSAGSGKAVAVSGLSLSGADAPNYEITGVAGLTVNIAPRPVLLLGVSAVNRVYDGSTVVAINSAGGSLSGVLAGDDLQLLAGGVTGSMADKHVGSAKVVNLTGLSLAGADLANYTVDGGGLRVDITPRTLVATATAADKVYDGSNLATVTLLDDRIGGDALSLASSSTTFASKDAGAARTVNIRGLTLTGADAGDYVLLADTLSTTATIERAPLTVAANTLSKVYGESINLTGTEFTTLGLVAGESLGLVTLASNGTASTAPVSGSPYTVEISDARGGSFNPANYALTYSGGLLTVTPRPLTIAANSVVRTADEPNPASFGFSTSVGGLVGGDSINSVALNAPAGSATAAGGSIFELVPSGAVFGAGQASNYALTYDNGLLVVLPRPPRVDDVDASAGNSGPQGFAVQVDPAELERALDALQRNASVVAQPGTDTAPGLPLALRKVDATAAEISVALAGDSRRITLPALLRLPLISFDPDLRRLIFGGPAAGSAPPSSTAP